MLNCQSQWRSFCNKTISSLSPVEQSSTPHAFGFSISAPRPRRVCTQWPQPLPAAMCRGDSRQLQLPIVESVPQMVWVQLGSARSCRACSQILAASASVELDQRPLNSAAFESVKGSICRITYSCTAIVRSLLSPCLVCQLLDGVCVGMF